MAGANHERCSMRELDDKHAEIIKAANTLVFQWHNKMCNNQFAEYALWKAVADAYTTTKPDRKWLDSRDTKIK